MTKSVLITIIVAALAFAGGLFAHTIQINRASQSLIDSFAARLPGVDLTPCRQAPAGIVETCVDNTILTAATQKGQSVLCQEIANESVRQQCTDRVAFLDRLSADTGDYCQGLQNNPLCQDFALTLLASLQAKREECTAVANETIRSLCLQQFPVPIIPVTNPTGSQPPARQYGLICASNDQACVSALPAFKAAILAKSKEQCQVLGAYEQICLNELAIYTAYMGGSLNDCSARNPLGLCEAWLITARALDGNAELCETIKDAAPKESCKVEVSSAQGQKRFDYLKK